MSVLTNRGGQHPRGKALGVRKLQAVVTTSTTIADDTTSTTVANEPTTTPTTKVDGVDFDKVCDDRGQHKNGEKHDAKHLSGHKSGHDDRAKTTRVSFSDDDDSDRRGSGHGGSSRGHGKHGRG